MSAGRVRLASLSRSVSRIGFGCASLGSRVAPRAGLEALARAHDAGISWFDVAPSYGDGQAETLLGQFARGRRDEIQICTKVGIAPPAPSMKARLLRPALRVALAAAPGLRAAIRKRRPAAAKLPLSAPLIAASLDASLQRLGTDHVDVLALHDATPEEAARGDVIAALDRVRASGKARAVAIASTPEAAAAGLAAWGGYDIAQFANNPFERGRDRFMKLASRAADVVTHSSFGTAGELDRMMALVEGHPELRALGGGGDVRDAAAALMARFALAQNRDGVVLMSMFSGRHLKDNIAWMTASGPDDDALGDLIRQALGEDAA